MKNGLMIFAIFNLFIGGLNFLTGAFLPVTENIINYGIANPELLTGFSQDYMDLVKEMLLYISVPYYYFYLIATGIIFLLMGIYILKQRKRLYSAENPGVMEPWFVIMKIFTGYGFSLTFVYLIASFPVWRVI